MAAAAVGSPVLSLRSWLCVKVVCKNQWWVRAEMFFRFFSILSVFLAALIRVELFSMSVPLFSSVSWFLTNTFMSSSHLFVGLPAPLRVLVVVIRPGFNSAAHLVHLSSLCAASLVAERRLIFLGASGVCDFTILWAMRRVAQRKAGGRSVEDDRDRGGRHSVRGRRECRRRAADSPIRWFRTVCPDTLVPDRLSRGTHAPRRRRKRKRPATAAKKQGITASVASPQRFKRQQSFHLRGATPKRTCNRSATNTKPRKVSHTGMCSNDCECQVRCDARHVYKDDSETRQEEQAGRSQPRPRNHAHTRMTISFFMP